MRAKNLLGRSEVGKRAKPNAQTQFNHARSSSTYRSSIDSSGDFQRALAGTLLLLRNRGSIRLSDGGEIAGERIRTAALSGSGL